MGLAVGTLVTGCPDLLGDGAVHVEELPHLAPAMSSR